MQEQLHTYIEDLTKATAARERLQAELATARLIQHALVPDRHPEIERTGVELEALLLPAREVGGDLYSYSRLDQGRLFFAIGDVSDKGVPAALFMSRANALLHAATAKADTPAQVLEQVNRELSEDNSLCMFVTLLAGILWLEDGRLLLSSAGHDSPIRVSAEGGVYEVDMESASPAGVNDAAKYQNLECRLQPGDTLVTYTDGVTEARNVELGLFGMQRLLDALRLAPDNSPATMIEAITSAVDAHAAGTEQSDDLTLLVFRYPGPGAGA
jgi:sigma-B regulation protein RsbU (phosphoserine phosphatase)